jgi:phosphatidate cytidylyltransferase
MTPPLDDLDPPTFQFGTRKRRRAQGDTPAEGDPVEGRRTRAETGDELPPESDDELEIPSFAPAEGGGAEGGGAAPAGPGGPWWRRLPFARSETGGRVVVAIPWVVFAIVIVAVGGPLFLVAMVALGVLGLRELFRMTAAYSPIEIPAYLTVAAMVVAAHYGSSFQILLALACSFPVIFAFAARRDSLDQVTVSIGVTLLGILWLGLGLSHAMLLRDLPDHGGALLVDVLVATFLADTAAYGAGRMFGSRKISPRISPNKTLEGLLGGLVGGTMGFWLAGLYQDWLPGTEALLMGLVIALVAPIGDLFASLIKRDLEIKDTGTLFGPHGGLIDRLDAVLFTVVAGYYISVTIVY